ncbi:hypothetical protein ACFLUE_02170 [Chloroflexota bacterium]
MRNEKGIMLLETVVVVAIVALVAGAGGMATFRVITDTERSSNHITAVRQVQNVGYWVSRDVMESQVIDADDDPETTDVEFLAFHWSDWEDGTTHEIVYTFHDMTGGLKLLKRQHVVRNIDNEELNTIATFIAEGIVSSSTLSPQNGAWILSIEARAGTEIETREYKIFPRVEMEVPV